jgi:type IV pilus assembly protein PilQ
MVGDQKGKVGTFLVFDDGSKKIFFRCRKQLVESFKTLLAEIDAPVAQIRLEARVVLANKNFEESLGFQWVGVYDRSASIKHFDFASLGSKAAQNTTLGAISDWSLNMIPTKAPYDAQAKGMGIIPFVFGNKSLDTKRLNLILNAAESKSEIKTILKPTLLVNSEEWAEVLVGEALPVQTRIDESIGANIANVSTTQYKDIGMKLKVRPIVSPGNEKIFLDIFVENSYVGESKITNVAPASSGVFNYTIETSRSKSKVLLNSGQTTLISGLISNYQKNVKTGLPFLKDFPGIGWLFRGSQKVVEDKELLIFITPVVVS